MTPQEALSILDKLAASVTGSRAQHAQWINALDTVKGLLPVAQRPAAEAPKDEESEGG